MTGLPAGRFPEQRVAAAPGRSRVPRQCRRKVDQSGSEQPPEDLRWLIGSYPWCTLRNGLSNEELALQFAAADPFVLATRTRRNHHPGEATIRDERPASLGQFR